MRKCADCGYLVLGDGDTCKHCGAALPIAAPAPPMERDLWTGPPPSAPSPPARSKRRVLLPLVVVVSMAFGWAAYNRSHNALSPGTSAFVAGHGIAYSSPDHTFDVQMPCAPRCTTGTTRGSWC